MPKTRTPAKIPTLEAVRYRGTWRQGNRPERYALHHPRSPYTKAYAKLKARGFQLHWQSVPNGKQAKVKKASKTKYTCPTCAQNAWAKPNALLICGNCYEDGKSEICLMLAAPGEDAEAA
jgi:hypothetical protein